MTSGRVKKIGWKRFLEEKKEVREAIYGGWVFRVYSVNAVYGTGNWNWEVQDSW